MMEVGSPTLQKVGTTREFDNSILKNGGNANIIMPPITVTPGTIETKLDFGGQLNMETPPAFSRESQSSQLKLNNLYNGGDTQQVHNSQVGLDDTQLRLAGETQLVNGQEGFDDMVVLQNDTLTASTIPSTNGDQSVSYMDAQPLKDSPAVPVFAHIDCAGMKALNQDGAGNISAPYRTKDSAGETETSVDLAGPNGRVLVTEVPTMTEHPEVQPAATGEQLGLTEASEKEGFNTLEPQLGLPHENVASAMEEKSHDIKGKGDKWLLSKDGEAEKDVQDDVNGKAKVLIEQDIQAIKGRKVVKKFGRKNYEGEVVDYDAENQWFKVVYEDGDEEDLELVEVKEILLTEDTSANTSTAKRKRLHREGGDLDQQARKPKKHRKDHTNTPDKKSQKKRTGNVKTARKSSAKKEGRKSTPKNFAKKRGTRHWSLSKLSNEETKVEKQEDTEKPKGKRLKSDASEDQDAFVGKVVKKDFDGILYSGVVAKFNKETGFYKVKYEDGDQEDLELNELKAVLVQ
eukprot:c22908_g1_i3 orf=291-1838(-)